MIGNKAKRTKAEKGYLLRITALVGVIFDGGFFVSLLQIILRSVLRNAEDFIVPCVVAFLRCSPEHLSFFFYSTITIKE